MSTEGEDQKLQGSSSGPGDATPPPEHSSQPDPRGSDTASSRTNLPSDTTPRTGPPLPHDDDRQHPLGSADDPPFGRQSPQGELDSVQNDVRDGGGGSPSGTSKLTAPAGAERTQSKDPSSSSPGKGAGPSERSAGAASPSSSDLADESPGDGDSDGSRDGDSDNDSHDDSDGGGKDTQDINQRVVYINDPDRTNREVPMVNNRISTSKYNILTFLPKNLFEQFHRYAYIYFLILVIMNQIPMLTVFGRTISAIPLLFVLSVTAIKDAYEDWGRQQSDKEENNRESLVLQDDKEYQPKPWKDIRVGEIVKVYANQSIPCDLVLLGTSDPSGLAYLETSNLDGETSLKSRYATQFTASGNPEEGYLTGKLKLICEPPNRSIYQFTGYIKQGHEHQSLGPNNIVLRSCVVKNTSWVVGVVVYAGQETKVMLNSSGPRSKRSRLEKEMNRETLWLALFLFMMCLVGGIGMLLWVNRHSEDLNRFPFYKKKYADEDANWRYYGVLGEAFVNFLSCVIVFQTMIPISLYVSMELVRLGQVYFMYRDLGMYDESSDSPFQSRALNICEDLGQIRYVFSDKTGTLTENKMQFVSASISGVDYSDANEFEQVEKNDADAPGSEASMNDAGEQNLKSGWQPKIGARVDRNLVRCLQQPLSEGGSSRRNVHEYMLVLAACNTVVPTRVHVSATTGQVETQVAATGESSENGEEDEDNEEPSGHGTGKIDYQGDSPDEQALVAAAASYGYTLRGRTSTQVTVDILGETERFEIVGIHEFDSTRRRMSVVIRCPDGTVKLLVKGADSAVLKLLQTSEEDQESTLHHLARYAGEGLRTLVIATRDLHPDEVQKWDALYKTANTELATNREDAMKEAALLVERDLNLIGATGIEDQLQKEVPETIAQLREASIKVWVLTGDKQETAISIAFSCLLITEEMQQIIINETTLDECREALARANSTYGKSSASTTAQKRQTKFFQGRRQMTAVNNRPGSSSSASDSERGSNDSPRKTDDNIANGDRDQQNTAASVLNNGDEDHEHERDPSHSESTSKSMTKRGSDSDTPLALVIDGNSLEHCLTEELEQDLFDLAVACKVVVCCRVAPYQKAAVVSLVKRKTKNDLTLAIGDGANDVSMIQMADVGVGICGKEGRQAVMASDFAIGQFRFLQRMLLVHGHWHYFRLGYMILYNFYRNAVLCFLLLWYILYCAFSPQSAINDWNLIFYSLLYTAVPTIVVGILDQDVDQKSLLKYPGLYNFGQSRLGYNQGLFVIVMLETLWQSLVLFYVPFMSYRHTPVGIYGLGGLWTIAIVILVNLQLALDIRLWTWIHHVAIWASILVAWICIFVLDSIKSSKGLLLHYWAIHHMVTEWSFWFDLPLIIILALIPRFFIKSFKQRLFPCDVQIAREAVQLHGKGGAASGVGSSHANGGADRGTSLSHLEQGESRGGPELQLSETLSSSSSSERQEQ